MSNSFPEGQNITDRAEIRRIFNQFYRSVRWAAERGEVSKPTVSKWLRGTIRNSKALDDLMPKLAAELLATEGACVGRPSVRSQIGHLRGKPKSGSK